MRHMLIPNGRAVKQHRENADWTQAELAEKARISTRRLRDIEAMADAETEAEEALKCPNLSLSIMNGIARALGVPAFSLYKEVREVCGSPALPDP